MSDQIVFQVNTPAPSSVEAITSRGSKIDLVAANIAAVDGVYDNLSGADTIGTVAADLLGSNYTGLVGANINDVLTVSGINADVTAVADIDAETVVVAGISAKVTTVANDTVAINGVWTDLDGTDTIGTVATNLSGTNTIGTVAAIDGNVTTVAGISANVTTVAGISANVTTVAGISSNVTTVAGDTAAINGVWDDLNGTDTIGTVAANLSSIDTIGTVAGISSDVTTVSGISPNVTTVADNNANVTTVATDLGLGGSSKVTITANNIANVNAVGGDITNVNLVATDLSGSDTIGVVATDLSGTDTIGTVAGSILNVNTVGGSIANVNTVAGISANVTTVAGVSANVTTVAGISDDVTTVANNNANVTIVADNDANITTAATTVASVTQDRFLGRQSTGAGPVEQLTAAQMRSGLNVEDGASNDTDELAQVQVDLVVTEGGDFNILMVNGMSFACLDQSQNVQEGTTVFGLAIGEPSSVAGVQLEVEEQRASAWNVLMVDGVVISNLDDSFNSDQYVTVENFRYGYDSEGGATTASNYTLDTATNLHAPNDPNLAHLLIDEGQSLGWGQNGSSDSLIYGQNSGVDGTGLARINADGSASYLKMPSVGIRPEGTSFSTLIQASEDLDSSGARDSGMVAAMHQIHRRVFDATGVRLTLVGMVDADPAEPMEDIMRGNTIYEALTDDKASAKNGARALGLTLRDVGGFMHQSEAEEALETSGQKMVALRSTYLDQITDDTLEITGQVQKRYQFDSIANAGVPRDPWASDFDPPEATLAVVEMGWTDDRFKCGAPVYTFEHDTDGLHLTSLGYCQRKATMGEIYTQQIFGQGWVNWKPLRAEWQSTTVCDLVMDGPDDDFVIDVSDTVVDTTGMVSVLGFQAAGRSGEIAISTTTKPAIQASSNGKNNRVRITFDSAVTEDAVIYYAQRKDASGSNGPDNGGRGCLRTAGGFTFLPTENDGTPTTLYHWCVPFTFNLGRP